MDYSHCSYYTRFPAQRQAIFRKKNNSRGNLWKMHIFFKQMRRMGCTVAHLFSNSTMHKGHSWWHTNAAQKMTHGEMR
jgi:hypothetical protein